MPEPSESALDSLCDREFLFVTGKGGVGKSTTAALLGMHAAKRGKRALVVHPEGSQPHPGLWGQEVTSTRQSVVPGVDFVLLESETAMKEYSKVILKNQRVVDALFHMKIARGFLTGMPGLSDWAILGKTWSWTPTGKQTLPLEQESYDLVILDAPASGDGTKMLQVPEIILDLAPQGRMHTDAEACLNMLRDPQRSAVVLVALAEELVVTETEENLSLVRQKLGFPLGPLLVNQIASTLFSPEDRQMLLEAASQEPLDSVNSNGTDSAFLREIAFAQAKREERQERHLRQLAKSGLPILQLPHVEGEFRGLVGLKKLQNALAAGL